MTNGGYNLDTNDLRDKALFFQSLANDDSRETFEITMTKNDVHVFELAMMLVHMTIMSAVDGSGDEFVNKFRTMIKEEMHDTQ